MSYAALGYDIIIGTPVGNQKISIPIEKIARDAGTMAVAAAWPPIQAKIHAEHEAARKAALKRSKMNAKREWPLRFRA